MDATRKMRSAPLDMSADEFRELGHRVVEQIADFYDTLPARQLTTAAGHASVRELIGTGSLPARGTDAADLLAGIAPLLFDHSLHNGHPRFFGYISASGAPLGALADLLTAAVNANLAKWDLSPVASEIETQAVRWLAELIGFPAAGDGLMVSGGTAANIHGFLAARRAVAPWDLRTEGLGQDRPELVVYVSRETHTWVDKAADFAGLGARAVRWVDCDGNGRMDPDALRRCIGQDRNEGRLPFLVVGTAGTVSTGAIDPLPALAEICRDYGIWFHVDGAYGAPAACLPEAPADLQALALADSVALDPHKWLYCPIEAACILTRNPDALRDTFDFRPSYYHFDEAGRAGVDYYQHGLQNTRGFRALKVWLALRCAGQEGYRASIREDIALARRLYESAGAHPEFEACSLNLSIVTFRYVPRDLDGNGDAVADYLDSLNRAIVAEVQKSGEAFVSNAVVDGDYLMRACIVNFRTTAADIDTVIEIVADTGRRLHARMRPDHLAA